MITAPWNNAMNLTKAARCAPAVVEGGLCS